MTEKQRVSRQASIDRSLRRTNLGRQLLLAFDAFESRIVDGIREGGYPDFKPSDGTALRNVALEGSRPSDMARQARITKQAMGQLIKDLERRDYVAVQVDELDRRARVVQLTRKGRGLLAVGQDVYRELEREWRKELGEPEFEQLRDLLERVVEAFG